jgi:hypothetical protein
MPKISDIHVTLSLTDRFTPEVLRVRYKLLTPIGRRVPPKGSMARHMLMLQVAVRRLGRVLVRDIPGASKVPWVQVGRTWGRWLEWIGTIYIVFVVAFVVVGWFLGWFG